MKIFGFNIRFPSLPGMPRMGRGRTRIVERSYDQVDGYSSIPQSGKVLTPEHQILRTRLNLMRAASRYIHRETGLGTNADRILRFGVLGEKTPMPVLRRAGDLPPGAAEAMLIEWRKWAENPLLCDYTGQHGLNTLLGVAASHLLTDGECLFWVRGGEPLRLELIDPGRVPVYDYANTAAGSVLGVKHDENGRREAYILNNVPINTTIASVYHTHTYVEVPANQILHWRIPLRSFAVRGVPLLWPLVVQVSTLDGFNAAAAKNAKMNASRVGIIQEMDAAREFTGDGERPVTPEDVDEGIVGWFSDGNRLQAPKMPPGVELTPWPSNFPTQAVEPFNRSITQQMAASLGVSHSELSGDLKGVNFSAGRLGYIAQRKTMKQIRAYLAEQVLSPTWRRFVSRATRIGLVPGLSQTDFDMLADIEWPALPIDPVDIRAQAQTDLMYIQMGVKSASEIIRDQGRQPDEVFAEIAAERELLKDILPPMSETPIMQPDREET